MPRTKRLPDLSVLDAALAIIHSGGPEALTFANLAAACGLSPATLVQRFKGKAELKQATLLHAWDQLDARTAQLARDMPQTPDGAVALLVGLSGDYGEIEAYAEGLLVLREDLRDPLLRARGAQWKAALCAALAARFAGISGAPANIGLLMASHWQGSLLWWGFEPHTRVDLSVRRSLEEFLAAVLSAKG